MILPHLTLNKTNLLSVHAKDFLILIYYCFFLKYAMHLQSRTSVEENQRPVFWYSRCKGFKGNNSYNSYFRLCIALSGYNHTVWGSCNTNQHFRTWTCVSITPAVKISVCVCECRATWWRVSEKCSSAGIKGIIHPKIRYSICFHLLRSGLYYGNPFLTNEGEKHPFDRSQNYETESHNYKIKMWNYGTSHHYDFSQLPLLCHNFISHNCLCISILTFCHNDYLTILTFCLNFHLIS